MTTPIALTNDGELIAAIDLPPDPPGPLMLKEPGLLERIRFALAHGDERARLEALRDADRAIGPLTEARVRATGEPASVAVILRELDRLMDHRARDASAHSSAPLEAHHAYRAEIAGPLHLTAELLGLVRDGAALAPETWGLVRDSIGLAQAHRRATLWGDELPAWALPESVRRP